DYDVTLNVPANYVVWGTGTLRNAPAVLQPASLARFQQSLTSDSTIHVATLDDVRAKRVTAAGPVNAWHFSARHIPDVAFNLSDHYVWDAGSVQVDDATRRRASVQAAYNDTAADYRHMVQYGRHALDWLSHNWPGVPYPYEKTTVVQGPAGMEYPMMANDESYPDTVFSRFVAEHEIAHTYMPFYMGINESRYAFMDEGWATTFEYLIGTADLGAARATQAFQEFRVGRWINDPSPVQDLPIITPADALHGNAYGNNAYGKPALGYLALKDMLGDSLFRTALHGYMDRWKGKHPIPWDFFNSVNDLTGRNLNWFWNAWYFSNGYIDVAIGDVRKEARRYAVTLENVGGMPVPLDLVATWADGSTETFHQTSAIWRTNGRRAVVSLPARKALRSVTFGGGIWMDADTTNDHWPRTK
ncbi:MAG TPA: M1 family aminopeptidase, partial [Gemmatimonadaceae bacterium]|nr:M1 family aminopeptidase [Gemmatimonadaceae bacterium]